MVLVMHGFTTILAPRMSDTIILLDRECAHGSFFEVVDDLAFPVWHNILLLLQYPYVHEFAIVNMKREALKAKYPN